LGRRTKSAVRVYAGVAERQYLCTEVDAGAVRRCLERGVVEGENVKAGASKMKHEK